MGKRIGSWVGALGVAGIPAIAQAQGVVAYGQPQPAPDRGRTGVVVYPKLGFLLAGAGEAEADCSASGSATCTGATTDSPIDYEEKSGPVGIGLDVMGHLSPNFRLGGGLLYVFNTELEDDEGDQAELGSDLTVAAIGEGVFDVSPAVALAVRGQLGIEILFPDDDLDRTNDALKDDCQLAESAGLKCEVKVGPYFGPTFGLGAGAIFGLRTIALRADFLFQWSSVSVSGQKVSGMGGEIDTSGDFTGTRFWIFVGPEF